MNMRFIDLTAALGTSVRYARLRRTFTLDRTGPGEFRIAARQNAIIWVNGVYLGRTYERTHEEEMRWRGFDLTPHLRPGVNTIALLAHHWGYPVEDIPGVPAPGRLLLAVGGLAGDCDLAGDGWRAIPAAEFLKARRHNSLIGHEERLDFRREPTGWCKPEFDDRTWATIAPADLTLPRCLPSPLRALREEKIFPARLVRQGALQPGTFVESQTSPKAPWWRIALNLPAPQSLNFLVVSRNDDRFWLDGVERPLPNEPPFDWVSVVHPLPVALAAGRHVFQGCLAPTVRTASQPWVLPFGWRGVVPDGGVDLEWAPHETGPWTKAALPTPDPDRVPQAYDLADQRLAALGSDGTLCVEARGDTPQALVLEFPANATLLPRLEIADASSGAEVELVYAERLSAVEGLLLPAAYTDRAILRAGPQTWQVSFQYKSAGVLIVILHPKGGHIRLQRVSAVYRRYDHDRAGDMQSSDRRINRTWAISRHTVEMGSQDLVVDGPWREQLFYIGDILVSHQAAYHLFSNAHEITEWGHTLLAQGQRADGLFSPNQPGRTAPQHDRLLDQVVLWPIELEHHWLYTGQRAFIRGLLPHVVRLMDGFDTAFARPLDKDPRLRQLTGWNWVDHPGLEDGRQRSIRHDGIPSGINFLYLLALQSSVRLLRAEGNAPEARRLDDRAQTLARLLRGEHWDAGFRRYADCVVDGRPSREASVHVNLLAIEAGLSDDPERLLERTWKRAGVLQICGSFFRYHLLEVFHRLDRHQLILNEIRSWWGGMVDADLTTLGENEPVNNEWGASVGHPWGASPCIHLVRAIAGLQPLEPGWTRFQCAPNLGDLERLTVAVPTPAGLIHAKFQDDGTGVRGTLHVPTGLHVELPQKASRETIRVVRTAPA